MRKILSTLVKIFIFILFVTIIGNTISAAIFYSKPKILFIGDSITEGRCNYSWSSPYKPYVFKIYKKLFFNEPIYVHGGWAYYISKDTHISVVNKGRGGTTFSTLKKHSILNRLKKTNIDSFDYIILQGGFNDLYLNNWYGNDTSSSLYAFEECCKVLSSHGKKVGFILSYQPNDKTDLWNIHGEELLSICNKYNIKYLDLRTSPVNLSIENNRHEYGYDSLHCNEKAYHILSEIIGSWIQSL